MHSLKMVSQQFCCCFFFTSSFPHRVLRVQPLPELLSFFLFSSSTTAVFSGADGDGGNIPLSESSAQACERSSHRYLLLGNQLCLVRLFTRQRQPRGGREGVLTHIFVTQKSATNTHMRARTHAHTPTQACVDELGWQQSAHSSWWLPGESGPCST